MINTFLIPYLIAAISYMILDIIWLLIMTPLIYKKYLSHLLAKSPLLMPAMAFYALYAFGIYLFVLRHFLDRGFAPVTIFGLGAALGVVAYGTYDLTNHATLREWPLLITIVDIAWGGFLTGAISVLTVCLFHKTA